MRASIKIAAGVAAVSLALAACGGGGPSSSATGSGSGSTEKVSVGFLMDETGAFGSLGAPQLAGFKTAISAYNDSQSQFNVTIDNYDDQTDTTTAIRDAKTILASNDLALVGPYNSNFVAPVVKLAIAAKKTILTMSAPKLDFNPGVFQMIQTGPALARVEMKFLGQLAQKANKTNATVSIVALNTVNATEVVDAAKAAAAGDGLTVAGTHVVDLTASDLTAQAQQVTADHPDYVMADLTDSGMVSFTTKLRQGGNTSPVINFPGGVSPATMKALGGFKDVYYEREDEDPSQTDLPDVAKMMDLAKKYGTASAATTPSFTAAYEDGVILGKALTTCGPGCTTDGLARALEKTPTDLVGKLTSPLAFSPTNHYRHSPSAIVYTWDASAGKAVAASDWITAS